MPGLKLPPIPSVSEVLRLYRINARKQLSQNFLLDMNMCRKIIRSAAHIKNHHICEVGPGPGGITQAIIEKHCRHLTVIEKDARFLPSLKVCHGLDPPIKFLLLIVLQNFLWNNID